MQITGQMEKRHWLRHEGRKNDSIASMVENRMAANHMVLPPKRRTEKQANRLQLKKGQGR